MSKFVMVVSSFIALGVASGLAGNTPAGEKPNEKWRVFAECRMVVLPQKAALPVIELFGLPEKSADAWDQLARLVESGQAIMEADLIVQGAAETPLVSESLAELKYPTEFDVAQLPRRLPAKEAPAALKAWPFIGTPPTAFETRKAGETLSFASVVSDGGAWLAVTVEALHSRLQSWANFDYAELPGGMHLTVSQPQFSHLKNKAAFRMRNGEKLLLGVHHLSTPEKLIELFVFRAKATRAGAALE